MTMKYETFVPRQFDQKELDKRVKQAQLKVSPTKLFTTFSFADALTQIESLTAEGWKLDIKGYTPVAIPMGMSFDLQWLMVKPVKLLKAEQLEAASKAELEYKAELEAEQQLAVERMVSRLIGESKDKQIKEQATAEEQAKLDAIAQAKQILGVA
ncbi:hypothetical protein ACVTMO_14695 [Pseudomonas segetis]